MHSVYYHCEDLRLSGSPTSFQWSEPCLLMDWVWFLKDSFPLIHLVLWFNACCFLTVSLWCSITPVCELWTLLFTTMAVITLFCNSCDLQSLGATQGCPTGVYWSWVWCCGAIQVHSRVPAKRQCQPHLSTERAVVWDWACLQSWVYVASPSCMVAIMCMVNYT